MSKARHSALTFSLILGGMMSDNDVDMGIWKP